MTESVNRNYIESWLISRTPAGGRVLDIGCGDGHLLARLVAERGVRADGIELDEAAAMAAIQRGLSVHHGNVEEGLDQYGDGTFDLVILSLTIQELGDPCRVMRECLRVGRRMAVVFPNFGHWRARWQLAVLGRAPNTPALPFPWHLSPNRHYLTVADWEDFVRSEGWRTVERGFAANGGPVSVWPNLLAEVAMYILERP
jgi:methionine biosynthesis protein MetW